MADWDMMFTFVDEIKTILEDNLEANLILEASATYKLPMAVVLDYESNVAEKDATILILPETNDVTGEEAESEILTGNVMLWVILRGTKRRLPRRLFLYEKAIRKTVYENRSQSDSRSYKVTTTTYGLERTAGSRLIKDMAMIVVPEGQFLYA